MSEEQRAEFLKRLAECARSGDTEVAHAEADHILREALESLGYGDLVAAWDEVPKWYA